MAASFQCDEPFLWIIMGLKSRAWALNPGPLAESPSLKSADARHTIEVGVVAGQVCQAMDSHD
ncbi:MAG TPA: hypothetical protein VKI17_11010, partial [Gemmataceae bacterium]|nr:hypothetical protein [Gemmataceae bacterium]